MRRENIQHQFKTANFLKLTDSPRKRYEDWYRHFRIYGTSVQDFAGSSARRNAFMSYWRKSHRFTGWSHDWNCQRFCIAFYTLTGEVHANDQIPF